MKSYQQLLFPRGIIVDTGDGHSPLPFDDPEYYAAAFKALYRWTRTRSVPILIDHNWRSGMRAGIVTGVRDEKEGIWIDFDLLDPVVPLMDAGFFGSISPGVVRDLLASSGETFDLAMLELSLVSVPRLSEQPDLATINGIALSQLTEHAECVSILTDGSQTLLTPATAGAPTQASPMNPEAIKAILVEILAPLMQEFASMKAAIAALAPPTAPAAEVVTETPIPPTPEQTAMSVMAQRLAKAQVDAVVAAAPSMEGAREALTALAVVDGETFPARAQSILSAFATAPTGGKPRVDVSTLSQRITPPLAQGKTRTDAEVKARALVIQRERKVEWGEATKLAAAGQ